MLERAYGNTSVVTLAPVPVGSSDVGDGESKIMDIFCIFFDFCPSVK